MLRERVVSDRSCEQRQPIGVRVLVQQLEWALSVLDSLLVSITDLQVQAPSVEELERIVARVLEKSASTDEREPGERGYVLLAPTAEGYVLHSGTGEPPTPGRVIRLEEYGRFVVTRYGPSPLPGDLRQCGYLERTTTKELL
jgi:hypothetical protein